jgi:hypothetical protein
MPFFTLFVVLMVLVVYDLFGMAPADIEYILNTIEEGRLYGRYEGANQWSIQMESRYWRGLSGG